MRSDELTLRAREAASIGPATSWPDWTEARILALMNARHLALASDEIIRARAGYGVQAEFRTTTAGQDLYRLPDRAIGGAIESLAIQYPGSTEWWNLERLPVTGYEEYDQGPTKPNRPQHFVVLDGDVQLMPVPDAAYPLRFRIYLRPSLLVTSQSSTLGGDGVDRGRITALNTSSRTVTVNTVPFNQLLAVPAAITSGSVAIDIVRPGGTFACSMYSVPQTLSGSVFTLGGTSSMSRVQVGDYVRALEQTDWPSNMPAEYHDLLARRTAMEIAQVIGTEEMIPALGAGVQADVERWRSTRNPQVKSQPRRIRARWHS